MLRNLKNHPKKIIALALGANAGLIIYLSFGRIESWGAISWMDVAGEGGSALLMLLWFGMLLKSRLPGRVTNLLALGIGSIFFSMWMDALDEVIKLPDTVVWDNWLESAPMLAGLAFVTFGLYHWHLEQLAINEQMEKRERLFREHRLFDKLTPLGRAEYLKRQLRLSIDQAHNEQRPLSLIAIDLDDFSGINQRYGNDEGDAVLLAMSQLLILNLRYQDLLCRLAGDRFVILLPDTGESQAWQIARELRAAVHHFAHRTRGQGERIQLRAAIAVVMALKEDPESLLMRLNQALVADSAPRAAAA